MEPPGKDHALQLCCEGAEGKALSEGGWREVYASFATKEEDVVRALVRHRHRTVVRQSNIARQRSTSSWLLAVQINRHGAR